MAWTHRIGCHPLRHFFRDAKSSAKYRIRNKFHRIARVTASMSDSTAPYSEQKESIWVRGPPTTHQAMYRLRAADPCCILNYMVQYYQSGFDISFAALSDATRRGVLEQLGHADASITDLAEKFRMTLTGMKKHVGVLEQAGLVTTEKIGRVRTCRLGLRRLDNEAAWIERYRQLWDLRFDELDTVIEELKRKEKVYGRKGK